MAFVEDTIVHNFSSLGIHKIWYTGAHDGWQNQMEPDGTRWKPTGARWNPARNPDGEGACKAVRHTYDILATAFLACVISTSTVSSGSSTWFRRMENILGFSKSLVQSGARVHQHPVLVGCLGIGEAGVVHQAGTAVHAVSVGPPDTTHMLWLSVLPYKAASQIPCIMR